jgi:rare lipoprotein A
VTRELILGALVALLIVAAEALSLLFVAPAHGAECAGKMLLASHYGSESGNRTATGERFDGSSLTAAMPSRAHLGERWRVSYAGRSIVVRINDIGPAPRLHRDIDLSTAAARRIGMIRAGVARVCAERL